jgi:hypothetical protein
MASGGSTLVDCSIAYPEIEGLNLAATQLRVKWW